ncbi:MAG: pyruvate formate lyase family protein [Acutalibacteraceae bacterium]|nr:pyruvate formate lyase family protein [Acutalibacteraceae bacterium]
MTERIKKLTELTLSGQMYADTVKTTYDEADLLLPRQQMESKRVCEYILNQEPKLTEYSCLTGFFNFDGSVVGDAFRRGGHKATQEAFKLFYLKPIDNLSTMEWQHATADYTKVLNKGIRGIIYDIEESLTCHNEPEQVEFLLALKRVATALIAWAHKCSERALTLSLTTQNEEYRNNLKKLSEALFRVPENAPETFYEAVLCIYLCFSADPDSVGTLDRYLYPFYKRDIKNGTLTKEEAAEYLQELFLMLQAATRITSSNFTRGGESHFCVGGYLPNGEDGFTELSRLIVESMIDLPTYIPQVTLRWTKKTPREVFRFMLDCERKDPHKRIAFQNDEKRIKCYTEICGIPFERAVGYTTVGCNEPAFLGAIIGSNSKINFLRSMETVFHKKSKLIENNASFDDFFDIFKKELFSDLERAYEYDNFYNKQRAQDINYISSLVFNDCIENAKSLTQGGGNTVIASPMCLGITNVIDSLCVVKQFVFDEKLFPMSELIAALKADWQGYEDMRMLILKKGKFFGNDDDTSNYIAQKLYRELYDFLKDKTNLYGYHWLIGDLLGYNIHHKWFGEHTKATPDGRYRGDMLKFGLGQSEGRDREGLSALLNSIAKVDPNGIGCGSTVTNITLDEQLIKNDDNFEKTVDLLLTYFQNGGVHFQLTYVSKDDLICAKETPDEYKHLRVRVTGFSDYFVKLNEAIQDDIIARTEQK